MVPTRHRSLTLLANAISYWNTIYAQGRNITFWWLEPGPNNTFVETFRLVKIENSSYEELVEAYHTLTGTGTEPVDRNARLTTGPAVSSPEARRSGLGHVSEVGGLRHNGVIVSPAAVQRAFSSAISS